MRVKVSLNKWKKTEKFRGRMLVVRYNRLTSVRDFIPIYSYQTKLYISDVSPSKTDSIIVVDEDSNGD